MSNLETAGLPAGKEPEKRVPGEKKGAIPEPVKGPFKYIRIEDIPIQLREHIAENAKTYQLLVEHIRAGKKKILPGSDDDLEIKQVEREARQAIARSLGAPDLDTVDLQAEIISRIWKGEAALPVDPEEGPEAVPAPPQKVPVSEKTKEVLVESGPPKSPQKLSVSKDPAPSPVIERKEAPAQSEEQRPRLSELKLSPENWEDIQDLIEACRQKQLLSFIQEKRRGRGDPARALNSRDFEETREKFGVPILKIIQKENKNVTLIPKAFFDRLHMLPRELLEMEAGVRRLHAHDRAAAAGVKEPRGPVAAARAAISPEAGAFEEDPVDSPEGKKPATSFEEELRDLEKKRKNQLKEARRRFGASSDQYSDAGESWERALRLIRDEFDQKLEALKKKHGVIEEKPAPNSKEPAPQEQTVGAKYKKGDRINPLNLEGEPLFDEPQPVSEIKEEGGRYMYKVEGSDHWYPEDIAGSERSAAVSPASEAAAEAGPAKPFSAAEAVNNPNFLKFLRDYAPSVQSEAGEPGVIEKWFKRYELKNRCVEQMTALWFDISLSEEFKGAVDKNKIRATLEARLSKMAAEDPASLARLSERLEYLRGADQRIQGKERTIETLIEEWKMLPGRNEEERQKKVQRINELRGLSGQTPWSAFRKGFARGFWERGMKGLLILGPFKDALKSVKAVQAAQKEVSSPAFAAMRHQLAAEAEQISSNVDSREQAEAIKKMIHARRLVITKRFFEDFPELRTSFEQAKKMAQTHLAELMTLSKTSEGRDLQKDGGTLQRAQKYFEALSQRTEADFLEGFMLNGKAMNREQIQQEINYLIAGTVQTQFDRDIEVLTINLDKDKKGVVDKLGGVIKKYLEKGELGSKKGEQVKRFFQNIIRRKIEELQRDGSDPAKCIALQVLLSDVLKAEVKAPVPDLGPRVEYPENIGGFKMGELVRLPGQSADSPATWKFVGPMKGAEATVRLESLEQGLRDGQGFPTEMTISLEDLQRANGKKISRPAAAPEKPESPAKATDTTPQPKAKASLDEVPRVDSVKEREPEQEDLLSILSKRKGGNPARAIPRSSERVLRNFSSVLKDRPFRPEDTVRTRPGRELSGGEREELSKLKEQITAGRGQFKDGHHLRVEDLVAWDELWKRRRDLEPNSAFERWEPVNILNKKNQREPSWMFYDFVMEKGRRFAEVRRPFAFGFQKKRVPFEDFKKWNS